MAVPQISTPVSYTEPSTRSSDSFFPSGRNLPTTPISQHQPYPPQIRNTFPDPNYARGSLGPPGMSPHSPRRVSPTPVMSHERSLSVPFNFSELQPGLKYDMQALPNVLQVPGNPGPSYDSATSGRRSPRMDPITSAGLFSVPVGGSLPRNFMPFKSQGGCS